MKIFVQFFIFAEKIIFLKSLADYLQVNNNLSRKQIADDRNIYKYTAIYWTLQNLGKIKFI